MNSKKIFLIVTAGLFIGTISQAMDKEGWSLASRHIEEQKEFEFGIASGALFSMQILAGTSKRLTRSPSESEKDLFNDACLAVADALSCPGNTLGNKFPSVCLRRLEKTPRLDRFHNRRSDNGKTFLHRAVQEKKEKLVKLLIAFKANPNLQDNDGRTPLHYAANAWDAEITEILLKNKADITIQDNSGRVPELLAFGETLRLLVEQRCGTPEDSECSTCRGIGGKQGPLKSFRCGHKCHVSHLEQAGHTDENECMHCCTRRMVREAQFGVQ